MNHTNVSILISAPSLRPEKLMTAIKDQRFPLTDMRVYRDDGVTMAYVEVRAVTGIVSHAPYFTMLDRSLYSLVGPRHHRECKIVQLMVEPA